jgi:AcrR family transcriptional regulator
MANGKRPGTGRRAEILTHAAQLFKSQGYHATTMDDVADSVKLNKGTLYYYYESKANLLFEMLLNTNERRLSSMRMRSGELSPDMLVRAFIEDTINYLAEHPNEATVSCQEAPFLHLWLSRDQVQVLRSRRAEFEHYAVDAVTDGQTAGLFVTDLDARVVAHSLTAIVSWFVRWYKPGGRLSAREAARQSSRLVLRGLLTPDALGRLDREMPPADSGDAPVPSDDVAAAKPAAAPRKARASNATSSDGVVMPVRAGRRVATKA